MEAAGGGAWVSRRVWSRPSAPPRLLQLTFGRGLSEAARFTADGHTIVYTAYWDGQPPEILSRRLDQPGSISPGLPPSRLLSVSSQGELAILLTRPEQSGVSRVGTLARVPLSGGAVRLLLEDMRDADWSPDGQELAVIRCPERSCCATWRRTAGSSTISTSSRACGSDPADEEVEECRRDSLLPTGATMSAPAKNARERAEEFLRDGGEFHLGPLVTEASHPRSGELSRIAGDAAAAGLAVLFDVDRDVVETYDRWSRSGQPEELRDLALNALEGGGRLFFTGCGATGRLSIQLDSIWRGFWQDRRGRGLSSPSPDAWEGRTHSVMAGGDYALIKSVEGFEDFAPFGRKQIADRGVAEGDMVFAITEGGETSFVIGTAWEALEVGATVAFVYNNPDEVLRAHVRRSREILDEPRIRKVNLSTGPMAITGSTRMQATSIQLLALLTVLEMTLRGVLGQEGAAEPACGPSSSVPEEMREGLRALHAELASEGLRHDLGRLVTAEEQMYRRGARTSYFADALAVDVLTDTTERSPTFCTPSFRKWEDTEAAESWAHLFTPPPSAEEAWTRLLRRAPQTIEWTEDDLRALLDQEAAERQGAVLREIGRTELMRFRIGLDGRAERPARAGDGVTAVVAEPDLPLLEEGAPFARALEGAHEAGAVTAVIGVGRRAALARLAKTAGTGNDVTLVVGLEIPSTPFLLDPLTRVGAKMLLNALSTCTMVRLGRVLGNRMIWVVPSNLKLIDRSIRYIQDLAGASYEDACQTLFEVIEHVEPRRRAGKVYPAPVGVASMRLRHGLSLEEAEVRLARELGGHAGPAPNR